MAVAQQEIEQAKALARQGNSQAAITLLSRLIQVDASNVQAWLALADVVEEPEAVEFCLQKVLNLDPGNATALEKLSKMKGGSDSMSGLNFGGDKPGEESVEGAARIAQQDPLAGDEYHVASAAVEPEASQILHDAPEQDRVIPAPGYGAAAENRVTADLGILLEAAATASGEFAQGIKSRSSFGRTDLILIGLTVLAGLVVFRLVGAAVVSNSSLFSSPPAESPDDVVQVVFDNIIAANREDVGAYMATIHPDSPSYNKRQVTIKSAFSLHDLSYAIFIPEMLEHGESEAVISFVLTTRKIRGPAFRDNTVTGEMTLQKHGGEWKIYDQRVDDIQYLN